MIPGRLDGNITESAVQVILRLTHHEVETLINDLSHILYGPCYLMQFGDAVDHISRNKTAGCDICARILIRQGTRHALLGDIQEFLIDTHIYRLGGIVHGFHSLYGSMYLSGIFAISGIRIKQQLAQRLAGSAHITQYRIGIPKDAIDR